MKKFWRHFTVTLGIFFACLIILAALFISIVRLFLPLINQHSVAFENYISELLGRPVSVRHIDVAWPQLSPVLNLKDVVVKDPATGKQVILIPHVRISFSLWESLRHWQIRTNTIRIQGLHLVMNLQQATAAGTFPSWIFMQPGWRFEDLMLDIVRPQNIVWHVGIKMLRLFYVHRDQHTLSLRVALQQPQLQMPDIFLNSLNMDRLTGELQFQQAADGWHIEATQLFAVNTDGRVTANLKLFFPIKGPPVIGLTGHFVLKQVKHVSHYLPLAIFAADLSKWLQQAFHGGMMTNGVVELSGPLDAFPFDKQQGIFRIAGDAQDVWLHESPGWPDIHHIDGHLVFFGRGMTADVRAAQIAGLPIDEAKVIIPKMLPNKTKLEVQGKLHTDLSQILPFLQQTPLQKKLGNYFTVLAPVGLMHLKLGLSIPLSTPESTRVNGTVTFNKAKIQLVRWHVLLKSLTGVVAFTQQGLSMLDIKSHAIENPMTLKLTMSKTLQEPSFSLQGLLHLPNLMSDVMQLKVRKSEDRLNFLVNNAILQGEIALPDPASDAKTPVMIRLQALHLSPENQMKQKIDPAVFPELNFMADTVWYGKIALGSVRFMLQPKSQGVRIQNFSIRSPVYEINASGYWQKGRTDFSGILNTPRTDKFLAAMGGSVTNLEAGVGKVKFDLDWLNNPFAVSLASLSGTLSLEIGKGRVIHLDSSTNAKMGFGRMLNIFSLQSLPRRLSLDFSDLFEKGYSFDSVRGDFKLQNGSAFTQNTHFSSAVAQIDVSGRIGLAARDYDLRLNVAPQVTSSIPVVATIATANPLAGIVAFAINKIVSPEVSKMTVYRYAVTGSWDKPEWRSLK